MCSANGDCLLPNELGVFGRTFEGGDEQSVWESVSVGKILGGVIEAKDVENDAGVSYCHRCGGVGVEGWASFVTCADDVG